MKNFKHVHETDFEKRCIEKNQFNIVSIERERGFQLPLMAQRQSLRRRRITSWGCGGAGHLRSSFPRINKENHNIKCLGCGRTGHVRSNYPRVNQEDPSRTSLTETKEVCSNRKGSADEDGDVRLKRP
ncbi:hypothetical protein TNCV_3462811 [Trichonephila clavipes]|nr:hypothetical protein TNCV_3462811 [Trichonephila clavipes]